VLVPVGDDLATDLPGSRKFTVVGVELLEEVDEARDVDVIEAFVGLRDDAQMSSSTSGFCVRSR